MVQKYEEKALKYARAKWLIELIIQLTKFSSFSNCLFGSKIEGVCLDSTDKVKMTNLR